MWVTWTSPVNFWTAEPVVSDTSRVATMTVLPAARPQTEISRPPTLARTPRQTASKEEPRCCIYARLGLSALPP